jgi:hypothetical protein
MRIKNLFYAGVGVIAYCKQAKVKDVKLKATPSNFVKKVFIDDAELSIHYMPDINKMQIFGGGILHNALTKKDIFVVDDMFLTFDKDVQEYVIGHELGHYVLGHYAEMGLKHLWKQFVFLGELQCASEEKRDLLLEATLFNRDYSKELEADKFAVEYSSKEAALKFLSMAHKMVPYNPEIIARYEAIAGYLPETKAVIEMIDFGIFKDAKVISLDSLEEGGEGNV